MATGDTPPRIPSRVHANEARRDPLRPTTDGKILARPRQPGSSITKEHGREPGQDAQRIRPSTPVMSERRTGVTVGDGVWAAVAVGAGVRRGAAVGRSWVF